ncbi:MAG: hypothetical protein OXE57_19155 [Alphaproteobacteria bacterium]|nr:hypothetical protein [Alphaproteobacteria bacterium]
MARKRQPMEEADLQAFKPILFQEIGPKVKFNANFCRNPMCPNFGPAPDLDAYRERYKVEAYPDFLFDRRYTCLACGISSRLLSNRSLRAAYVWFKRQSIPFAACDRAGCPNEGVNAFEYWSRYRFDKETDAHKIRCGQGRRCRSSRHLGEALNLPRHLDDPGELERRMAWVFKHLRGGVTVTNMLQVFGVDDKRLTPDHYGAVLRNVAARIRDYQSYCNTDFMAPGYPDSLDTLFRAANDGAAPGVSDNPFNGMAALQTDALFVPVRLPRAGYPGRERQLPVLVTALRLHEPASLFVLAVHPCAVFRDGNAMPRDPGEALADAMRPVAERQFDHLLHYGTDHGQNALSGQKSSYLGGSALLMRDEYAELAHFMVVKDLTHQFERVLLTMDGKHTAYRSAAAVFAGNIQTRCEDDPACRRAEIAIVQTVQTVKAGQRIGRLPSWGGQLAILAKDWRDRTPEGPDGPAPEAKATLFRRVMSSARTDEGSWAWPRRRREREVLAVLWLSQGPDREWPPESDTVGALLRYTSLQRVNTAIGMIRSYATYLERPEVRSGGGAKYVKAAENIELLSCQAWLAWFTANYGRTVDRTGGKRPADLVGIEHDVGPIAFEVAERETLRLGWREAEEMTERLGLEEKEDG